MAFELVIGGMGGDEGGRCLRWLAGLGKGEQTELLGLLVTSVEMRSGEDLDLQLEVIRDWIEDHGGYRGWQNRLKVRKVL